MRISMPNNRTTTTILLKDVLYAPKMGITLVSIGKIDAAVRGRSDNQSSTQSH